MLAVTKRVVEKHTGTNNKTKHKSEPDDSRPEKMEERTETTMTKNSKTFSIRWMKNSLWIFIIWPGQLQPFMHVFVVLCLAACLCCHYHFIISSIPMDYVFFFIFPFSNWKILPSTIHGPVNMNFITAKCRNIFGIAFAARAKSIFDVQIKDKNTNKEDGQLGSTWRADCQDYTFFAHYYYFWEETTVNSNNTFSLL